MDVQGEGVGIEGGQAAAGRIKNATHGMFFKRKACKECKMMIKTFQWAVLAVK